MKITLFDKKLETKCTVSLKMAGGVFSILSRYSGRIPVSLLHANGINYVNLFVPQVESINRLPLSMIPLKQKDISDRYIRISLNADEYPEIDILKSIINLSSVLIEQVYLDNSEIFMDFRFHSSRARTITMFLKDAMDRSSNITIKYMGPSLPLTETFDLISLSEKIMVIQISTNLDSYSSYIQTIASQNENAIYIPELRGQESRRMRAMAFYEKPIEDKAFEEISSSDGVYQIFAWDRLMELNRGGSGTISVPCTSVFYRKRGNRMVDTTLISEPFAQKFVKNYMKISANIEGALPELEYYCPLAPEVWKWL